MAPAATSREGVFVTGTAAGPMDIVDTIMTAGAAASEAAAYIGARSRQGDVREAATAPVERSMAHA